MQGWCLKKMSDIIIKSHCSINGTSAVINGVSTLFNGDFAEGIRELYRSNNISYPKFFKMDNLSKLAFLAAELALKDVELPEKQDRLNTGVILMTSNSSLDTDCRFSQSINNPEEYYPSPAVFVYTLPNVMAGEICIRNSFQGENCVYINEVCDWEFLAGNVRYMFESGKLDACICGWCDLFMEGFNADIFYVERCEENQDYIPFKNENIVKIIKNL